MRIRTIPQEQDWHICFESAFLEDYFSLLESMLGPRSDDWQFDILHHNSTNGAPTLPEGGKDRVLLWFSDESSGSAAAAASRYQHVFKSYALADEKLLNVHPFPIFGAAAVCRRPQTPWERRRISVFFSGNLNANRLDLFLRLRFPVLDRLPKIWRGAFINRALARACKTFALNKHFLSPVENAFLVFTDKFGSGMAREEYARCLADSKIVLCPAGFISAETMRHFEALSLGCVVLSCALPNSPFYSGSPILQRSNWRGVYKTVSELLLDEHKLENISSASSAWWHLHCSPEAAARNTAAVLTLRT
jgi:hypothetical protein